ncbi:MAG: nuclear transport factor 2 family protein [Pseudolabrys sp.]
MQKFVADIKLIEGDRAAILGRLHAKHYADGRTISYRIAHFMKFKNDRLVDYRSVLDSFDAAEQVLGHRLDAMNGAGPASAQGSRVAV